MLRSRNSRTRKVRRRLHLRTAGNRLRGSAQAYRQIGRRRARCRKFYAYAILGSLGMLIFLAASLFGVLRFGNPQWHKYIYMAQCYYFIIRSGPGCPTGVPLEDFSIRPLPRYSGVWRAWSMKGRLQFEGTLVKGKLFGKQRGWNINGQSTEQTWRAGTPVGRGIVKNRNGVIIATGFFKKGERWRGVFLELPGNQWWNNEYSEGDREIYILSTYHNGFKIGTSIYGDGEFIVGYVPTHKNKSGWFGLTLRTQAGDQQMSIFKNGKPWQGEFICTIRKEGQAIESSRAFNYSTFYQGKRWRSAADLYLCGNGRSDLYGVDLRKVYWEYKETGRLVLEYEYDPQADPEPEEEDEEEEAVVAEEYVVGDEEAVEVLE